MRTLGELCEKPQYGYTAKAASSGVLKFLRTTDIAHGPIDWETVPYCAVEPNDYEKYLLRDGDLLISRSGSIGVSTLVKDPQKSVFASYLIRFRPKDDLVDPQYLAWYLQSPRYWLEVRQRAAGIGMSNINAKKLSAIPVPLAPRHMQAMLSARIKELVCSIQKGSNALRTANDKCITFERSLTNVVGSHGKRTTVGDLLERIEAGRSFRCEERPASEEEWGVIKVSAMTWGSFRENENKAVKELGKVDARWEIAPGDILLSRANTSAYVGASVLVGPCRSNLLLSDKSLRLVPSKGVDPSWLQLALSSPRLRTQMSELATGTSDSMRNLSQSKLRSVEVRVPSLDGQRNDVERARAALNESGAVRKGLDRAETQLRGLRRSVLRQAFGDA